MASATSTAEVKVADDDSASASGWGREKRRNWGEEQKQDEKQEQDGDEIGPSASEANAAEEEAKEAEPEEETYVEDDVNAANDIRRRIWRIKDALSWIAPNAEMLAKVGGVLWRLSERNREAAVRFG